MEWIIDYTILYLVLLGLGRNRRVHLPIRVLLPLP